MDTELATTVIQGFDEQLSALYAEKELLEKRKKAEAEKKKREEEAARNRHGPNPRGACGQGRGQDFLAAFFAASLPASAMPSPKLARIPHRGHSSQTCRSDRPPPCQR